MGERKRRRAGSKAGGQEGEKEPRFDLEWKRPKVANAPGIGHELDAIFEAVHLHLLEGTDETYRNLHRVYQGFASWLRSHEYRQWLDAMEKQSDPDPGSMN